MARKSGWISVQLPSSDRRPQAFWPPTRIMSSMPSKKPDENVTMMIGIHIALPPLYNEALAE
jgi:hypothetical protein